MTHREVNHDDTPVFAEGWILDEAILHITDEQLDQLVAKRTAKD